MKCFNTMFFVYDCWICSEMDTSEKEKGWYSMMKPPYPSLIFGIPTSLKFSYAAMYSFQYHPENWFYKILSQFLGTAIFLS